jgi:hypothetical protein
VRQRVDHDLPFPGLIRIGLPVLDGAATAAAEIGAKGIDALGAGGLDVDEMPAQRPK